MLQSTTANKFPNHINIGAPPPESAPEKDNIITFNKSHKVCTVQQKV